MDLHRKGSEWLARRQRVHAAESLTYTRAGQTPIAIRMTRAKANAQISDADGQLIGFSDQDFTFTAADLVIANAVTLPVRGDRITTSSTGPVYEVLDVPGIGPYRWCDGYNIQLRIHTKFIGIAPQSY